MTLKDPTLRSRGPGWKSTVLQICSPAKRKPLSLSSCPGTSCRPLLLARLTQKPQNKEAQLSRSGSMVSRAQEQVGEGGEWNRGAGEPSTGASQ